MVPIKIIRKRAWNRGGGLKPSPCTFARRHPEVAQAMTYLGTHRGKGFAKFVSSEGTRRRMELTHHFLSVRSRFVGVGNGTDGLCTGVRFHHVAGRVGVPFVLFVILSVRNVFLSWPHRSVQACCAKGAMGTSTARSDWRKKALPEPWLWKGLGIMGRKGTGSRGPALAGKAQGSKERNGRKGDVIIRSI